jgi:two-component sensor histidine kinase
MLASAAPLREGAHGIAGAVATFTDVTGLKRTATALEAALADREILFRELRHRFRDNLQLLSTLLEMQADTAASEETRTALEASRARIQSMARLQDRLYHSLEAGAVDMAEYLRDLGETLRAAYCRHSIALEVLVARVVLDVDRALSCGLLVNELVTNACKHALPPPRAGVITIRFRQEANQYVLSVADTGVGLPTTMDVDTAPSLGMRIIRSVRQKLRGTIHVERTPHTTFVLTFPVGEEEDQDTA